MTARTLINCDGPKCPREINSVIHAGTWLWLTLKEGNVFTRDPQVKKLDKHFCSDQCIHDFFVVRMVTCHK